MQTDKKTKTFSGEVLDEPEKEEGILKIDHGQSSKGRGTRTEETIEPKRPEKFCALPPPLVRDTKLSRACQPSRALKVSCSPRAFLSPSLSHFIASSLFFRAYVWCVCVCVRLLFG